MAANTSSSRGEVYSFGEKRNSLSIQNGGLKCAKFAYICNISQVCSYLTTKHIFATSMTV